MLADLLARAAGAASDHPRRTLGIALLVCSLLSTPLLFAELDMTFQAVVPTHDVLVQRYLATNEATGLGKRLVVLLEGPEDRLDAATELAVSTLRAWPDVATAVLPPPSVTGARIVSVELARDPMVVDVGDILSGGGPYSDTSTALNEALAGTGVRASWTGIAAIFAEDQSATIGRISRLTPLSLLLVLAVFAFVERNPLRLALMGAILGGAFASALGLTSLAFGSLTFNETFAGMLMFGLGIDFGLHLTVRLREERAEDDDFRGGLRRTLRGTGRAIAAGGLTTAGALCVFGLAPEPLARRMGMAGALGLAFCFVLMMTALPAGWTLLARAGKPVPRRPIRLRPVGAVARWSVRRPGITVLATGLIVALALAGTGRFRVATDLASLFNRDVPSVEVGHRVQQQFGVHGTPWLVVSETAAEAAAVRAGFEEDPLFAQVVTAPRDDRWITYAFSTSAGLDRDRAVQERLAAEAVHPSATGFAVFIEAAMELDRPWVRPVGLGILIAVLFVLAVDLRDPRWVLVALCPVLVGTTVTFGLLCWMDTAFSIIPVIGVPLLVGLGVDDGLHVVHRMREDPTLAPDTAATSVGRAIVFTTATTCASVLGLLFSNHAGMEDLAVVFLVGLPSCLLASVALVPALAVLLRLRPAPRG